MDISFHKHRRSSFSECAWPWVRRRPKIIACKGGDVRLNTRKGMIEGEWELVSKRGCGWWLMWAFRKGMPILESYGELILKTEIKFEEFWKWLWSHEHWSPPFWKNFMSPLASRTGLDPAVARSTSWVTCWNSELPFPLESQLQTLLQSVIFPPKTYNFVLLKINWRVRRQLLQSGAKLRSFTLGTISHIEVKNLAIHILYLKKIES